MSLKFQLGTKMVSLQGNSLLNRTFVSLRSLKKIKNVEFSALLWPLDTIIATRTGEGQLMPSQHQDVIQLLKDHKDVFGEIKQLPPHRKDDHQIPLQLGTGPISVHPYRYGHIQKDEIEKLVFEMLTARVIRPSTSPFSSPVLLVKKRDGS